MYMKYSLVNYLRAQAYNFDSEYGQGVYFLFARLCSQQGIGNDSLISAENLYAKQWRKPVKRGEELQPKIFHIVPNSPTFGKYYDEVQESLSSMAGLDELLQGCYSTYIYMHVHVHVLCTCTCTCTVYMYVCVQLITQVSYHCHICAYIYMYIYTASSLPLLYIYMYVHV